MAKKKREFYFGRDNTPDPGFFGSEEYMGTVNNGKGWATYSKRKSGKINRFFSEKLGIGDTDAEVNERRAAAARRRLDSSSKRRVANKSKRKKS